MLARCANENCMRPLQGLFDGRLFRFEIVSISLAARDEHSAPYDEKPQRETAHFWLCGACAASSTLVLEPAKGLKLVSAEASDSQSGRGPDVPELAQAKGC
jgi:hypothetical protein